MDAAGEARAQPNCVSTRLSRKRTVSGSGVSILRREDSSGADEPATLSRAARWMLNFTSLEVSACPLWKNSSSFSVQVRSEEHTSELQSRQYLVCRLLLEKKKKKVCVKYI